MSDTPTVNEDRKTVLLWLTSCHTYFAEERPIRCIKGGYGCGTRHGHHFEIQAIEALERLWEGASRYEDLCS